MYRARPPTLNGAYSYTLKSTLKNNSKSTIKTHKLQYETNTKSSIYYFIEPGDVLLGQKEKQYVLMR